MIGGLAAGVGSIALLPLGGCVPATYADWHIDTDKASSDADVQAVRRLLSALGYTEHRPLDFESAGGYLYIEVRMNTRATKINVTFVERMATRFSPLANERIAAIDAGFLQEFGHKRVKRT